MSFITRLSFINMEKTGRLLAIENLTDRYSENSTGYGTPNPDVNEIDSISFLVNTWGSNEVKKLVQSVLHPIDTLPTIVEIMGQYPIYLDSFALGMTPEESGTKSFTDGVLEINMVHRLKPQPAVGIKGNNFLQGEELLEFLVNDFVSVNNQIHRIDRLNSANSETIIFLTDTLKSDCTEVQKTTIANLKILVTKTTERVFAELAAKIALENCEDKCTTCSEETLIDSVSKFMAYKTAAEIAFDCHDFKKAHNIIRAVSRELNSLCVC